MKKTFKNQLPVFIPECILFAMAITFGVLLIFNFPFVYSFLAKVPQYGVKGSVVDLILFCVSASILLASGITLICMGHLYRAKDPVKWIDRAAFISGIVILVYDIAMVSVTLGLLGAAGVIGR